ncbi:MAG: folylpolyglutamate synthase/dihydrofolate synthase family protein [bacterium]
MSYTEILDYMYSRLPMFHRIGPPAYKPDLKNTIKLCNLLGNPQDNFRSIHVAGTNGKGSVSHMLASILQQQGLRVGLYTSPHLKDFRERIRVNGKKISKSYFIAFIRKHQPDFDKIQPSFFEMTVGLAFQYFSDQQVDIAVIETGLGGRLDSTNVIKPLLSVITNISYDHTQLLGKTLARIAGEKAGIIKPRIPVVIGETQPETVNIFKRVAKSHGSSITFADRIYSTANVRPAGQRSKNLVLDILRDDEPWMRHISSPLPGIYQLKNIVTVMAACDALNDQGFGISQEQIKTGIRDSAKLTGIKGRWQVLGKKPLIVCDTGHNASGLTAIIDQIGMTPHANLHIVFGLVSDKAVDDMLNILPRSATYYFCRADIPRGLDAIELERKAGDFNLKGKAYPSVISAFGAAKKRAGPADMIFVGGSTFVVAEVI